MQLRYRRFCRLSQIGRCNGTALRAHLFAALYRSRLLSCATLCSRKLLTPSPREVQGPGQAIINIIDFKLEQMSTAYTLSKIF